MAEAKKAGPKLPGGSEGLFGRIAVSLGFITDDQLKECLTEQEQAKKDGRELRVGQILLKRRWLTTTQFLRIMSEQESRVGHSESRPTMVRGELEEASRAGEPGEVESQAQLQPGRMMGRYEILRQVGRGGMGVVYEARDTLLKRRVALKVLREDMVDPMMGRRLEKEAVTAARLKHPNIVTLYEAGIVDGVRFLSMEYVEGKSLREVMESAELDTARRAEIVEQVARAVDYAHSRGVIHRDLKPGNIMIDAEGRAMVMDFGLARVLDDFSHASRTGALVGTPGYMAPEQIMGTSSDVNARTDVYALGVILYEMLAGHLPFDGRNPSEICSKILQSDPPPIEGAPSDLEYAVRRAMNRNRNDRYATAGEFADDLKRFRDGEPVRAAPMTIRKSVARLVRRHRAGVIAGAVAMAFLLLGVLGLVGWRLKRASDRRLTRAQALEAERRGDWETALRLWIALEQGGDEGASSSAREAARQLDAARERAKAVQLRTDARDAQKEYERLKSELAGVEARIREEMAKIEPYDPPDRKQTVWRLERRRDDLQADLERKEARIVGLHISALQYDPTAAGPLLEFLMGLLRQAEEEGDFARARVHEGTIRQILEARKLEAERQQLERPGTVTIATDTSGADIDLYGFEELPDRRLMTKILKKNWDRTPVTAKPLAPGSYLMILRRDGFREVRFPLLIGRGQEYTARVVLYTEAEIGPEFVYVPAGQFISGDPKAYMGGSRRTREKTADFFIARHELTVEEYSEFLNDRSFHTLEEAKARVPRHEPHDTTHLKIEGDRILLVEPQKGGGVERMNPHIPVHEITWADVEKYCQWRTQKARDRGENSTYRVPTALEWEKAARGVDGRAFPWGDRFDWTFTTGYYSANPPPKLRKVGLTPADESIYGVRDMAGNLLEWTDDWFDSQKHFKLVSGGSYGATEESYFRSASRRPHLHHRVPNSIAVRLVKDPPKR